MEIQITARHMELTDEMRGFIQEKMTKVERHLQNDVPIVSVLSEEKHSHVAEVHAHDRGNDFFGKAELPGWEQAVEEAIDRLDKQLRRHKDKLVRSAKSSSSKELSLTKEEEEAQPE